MALDASCRRTGTGRRRIEFPDVVSYEGVTGRAMARAGGGGARRRRSYETNRERDFSLIY